MSMLVKTLTPQQFKAKQSELLKLREQLKAAESERLAKLEVAREAATRASSEEYVLRNPQEPEIKLKVAIAAIEADIREAGRAQDIEGWQGKVPKDEAEFRQFFQSAGSVLLNIPVKSQEVTYGKEACGFQDLEVVIPPVPEGIKAWGLADLREGHYGPWRGGRFYFAWDAKGNIVGTLRVQPANGRSRFFAEGRVNGEVVLRDIVGKPVDAWLKRLGQWVETNAKKEKAAPVKKPKAKKA